MIAGKNLIGGNWVEGTGAAFQSLDPATGEVLWEGAASTAGDVEAALAAARAAFADWSSRPIEARIDVIRAFGAAATAPQDELARVIAYGERTPERSQTSGDIRSRLEHRPHGVMAVFGPYNFPAHLPNGHIVPGLLAGNTVVLKPSSLTPWSADETLKIWLEAGLPDGVINLVQGPRVTGEALIASPEIDGLLFTGSVATGAAISQALAARLEVILALELGGNNALLADGSGDHKAAALLTIQSAFVTTGQRCTCARRLVVPHGGDGDKFLEVLAATMAGIRVGAWDDDPEPFMGPLISEGATNAVVAAQGSLERTGLCLAWTDRRQRRQRAARRGNIRAVFAGRAGGGFRGRPRGGQQHPLRPRGRHIERGPIPLRTLLQKRPGRGRQLEPAADRGQQRRALWRPRHLRQSSPRRQLCSRLLRLSGSQH